VRGILQYEICFVTLFISENLGDMKNTVLKINGVTKLIFI